MNILWAFNIELPKDPQTGLPIPMDKDDTTDVRSPVKPCSVYLADRFLGYPSNPQAFQV